MMQIDAIERTIVDAAQALPLPFPIDPLDFDLPDDEVVVTTRRGLVRLALVAADTASRFERETIGHDPVAWMLAPRALFQGRSAIEACLDRQDCLRAVLLHGLSIGLDAEPEEIDDLTDDAEDDADVDVDADADAVADGDGDGFGRSDGEGRVEPSDRYEDRCDGRPRLWTSLLVDERDGGTVHAFDAVIAASRLEAERRLRARHGSDVLHALDIVEGFDPNLPLAEALVSPAVADMLAQVAQDPGSPLARGLSVYVEQRFAA